MNAPSDPAGKTARATCETTEAVVLGRACAATARYETPTKRAIAITPSAARVVAAFFPCGRRKALTPFAIASTPVSAVDPEENARSTTNAVTAPVPAASGCGTTACGHDPVAHFAQPTPSRQKIEPTTA